MENKKHILIYFTLGLLIGTLIITPVMPADELLLHMGGGNTGLWKFTENGALYKTIVLNNSNYHVNIGQNRSTPYNLSVNGSVEINGSLDVRGITTFSEIVNFNGGINSFSNLNTFNVGSTIQTFGNVYIAQWLNNNFIDNAVHTYFYKHVDFNNTVSMNENVTMLRNLSVGDNVTATYFIGNGSQLTGIATSNLLNTDNTWNGNQTFNKNVDIIKVLNVTDTITTGYLWDFNQIYLSDNPLNWLFELAYLNSSIGRTSYLNSLHNMDLTASNNINLTCNGVLSTNINLSADNVTALNDFTTIKNIYANKDINLGGNIVIASNNGAMFGTTTSQKLAFYGTTPIAQQAQLTDLKQMLINLGLYGSLSFSTPLNLSGGTLTAGLGNFTQINLYNKNPLITITDIDPGEDDYTIGTRGGLFTINNKVDSIPALTVSDTGAITWNAGLSATYTLTDTNNFVFGSGTGNKIGTATTQKLAFYNSNPITQPASTIQLGKMLSNLGLRAAGNNYPIRTNGYVNISGNTNISKGVNIGNFTNSNYTQINGSGIISQYGKARMNYSNIKPATLQLKTGTTTSTITDLRNAFDNRFYNITEAAVTPGLNLTVNFTGVKAFNWVNIIGIFEAGTSHSIAIQLWNWQTNRWNTFDAFQDGNGDITTFQMNCLDNHDFMIPSCVPYISTGANWGRVQIRFIHPDAGNPSHTFALDVVNLCQ